MRHPFLFQQMTLFSLLGPTYGTPDMMRRLLFSPDMPLAKLREYFDYVQAESQVVALDMMGLNPLRLNPRRLPMPILVLGARNDVFVSPAMVEETARFYTNAEVRVFPNMAHAMMMELNWREVADHLLGWLERVVEAQPATS
jgi:pimeloyl-ACP methyl ester carboxylesterase